MFTKIKNFFNPPKVDWTKSVTEPVSVSEPITVDEVPKPKPKAVRKPKPKPVQQVNVNDFAKAKATAAGEPYVSILSVDVDPENINNGSFELDWNDKFLLNLIKAGYKLKDSDKDSDIVDRWFHTVCRNVVLEVYEQENADPEKRDLQPLTKPTVAVERVIRSQPLGDGRSEIS